MRFIVETENVVVLRNWEFLMENYSSNVITETACVLRKTSYVTILESTQISHFVLRLCDGKASRNAVFLDLGRKICQEI